MKQDIQAKEETLEMVFSDNYSFQIPDYQRPYAWTKKETSELLNDIWEAATKKPKSPYFLGSIVLSKEEKEGQSYSDVIDGQQRLTTLTILFSVLRELCEIDDGKRKNAINKYICAEGDPNVGRSDHFRLRVRNMDKNFFEEHIQKEGAIKQFVATHKESTDSRKRMYESAKYLWEQLEQKDPSERNKLIEFLMQHCYLVVVQASSVESACRIFSVLNTRGLDLLPTDILKARIFEERLWEGSKHELKPYTEKWNDTEEGLGREHFRDLLTHIRMVRKPKKAQGSLEDEFLKEVIVEITPDNIRSFIDNNLNPMADAYQIVSGAKYQGSQETQYQINEHLKHLGRIDNKDWIPSAIYFFDKHKKNQDFLLRFIRDLERLAYTFFILRKNVNERIERFAGIIKAIDKDREEDLFKEYLSEEKLTLQLSEKEKSAVRKELNESIYEVRQVCKPLLLRLNSWLTAAEGVEYENRVISVEHVLPQNPKECSKWLEHFNKEEREEWTHKLANLVLLSTRKNSRASNLEFDRKKEEYFEKGGVTTFALTLQVIGENEWTPCILQERQKMLIDYFCKEWRL